MRWLGHSPAGHSHRNGTHSYSRRDRGSATGFNPNNAQRSDGDAGRNHEPHGGHHAHGGAHTTSCRCTQPGGDLQPNLRAKPHAFERTYGSTYHRAHDGANAPSLGHT
ncbi:MAG: hypothetical protein QF714_09530 [Dehalococcoidia bacterium]|nr:hypothetical protein [Dehalococcoidia bacterium]